MCPQLLFLVSYSLMHWLYELAGRERWSSGIVTYLLDNSGYEYINAVVVGSGYQVIRNSKFVFEKRWRKNACYLTYTT
jgi:hypothetical protein